MPVTVDVDTIYHGFDRVLPHVDYLIASSDFPGQWTGKDDPFEALEAIAAVVAARGLAGAAARLGGAAETLRSTLSVRPLPFDAMWTASFMDRARASTDPATWSSAWNEGSSMGLDDAIELALSHSPTPASKR